MANKRLEEIPPGMSAFVDTNILLYHLLEDELYGESCKTFLKRVEEKDVLAFISPVVVSESLFIYIRLWVVKEKKISPKRVLEYLKKNRSIINTIDLQKPQKLFSLFKILPIGVNVLKTSFEFIKIRNLLPDDAINLSIITHHKIPAIATLDDDFNDIQGIKVFKPSQHS